MDREKSKPIRFKTIQKNTKLNVFVQESDKISAEEQKLSE